MFKPLICQAVMALSLHVRPLCLGQDRVWGAGGSERHNTGNVLLAPSQDHSTQMVQDKRRAWPTSFSCSSSLPLSPPGSVPLPPSLLHIRLTKGHAQNIPNVVQGGEVERGVVFCHSVLSLDFVFPPLSQCQRNKVHLGANKSF